MPDDDAARLVKSHKEERQHMKKFVDKRLNTNAVRFWEPLFRLTVKIFKSLSKKKNLPRPTSVM